MELIALVIIILISFSVLILLIFRLKTTKNNEEFINLKTELALANQALENKKQQIVDLNLQIKDAAVTINSLRLSEQQLTTEKINLNGECVRLLSENKHLKHGYDNLEGLLAELKEQLTKEFGNIKNQALLELQNKATETLGIIGKTSVVEPIAAKLSELNTKIIELKKETHDVSTKSASLSEQANNLAQVLIRDSQKKGEFGEMILANILEFAGLKEKVSYIEQQHINTIDPAAKNLRPDCLINLPDGRGIIIDSKNIIGEYYNAVNNAEDKNKAVRNAIANTIKLFASKEYVSEMERITSRNIFDYMIVFIPNEGLFNLIVEMDAKQDERGLLWLAYAQKVIIAGPSTILGLLAIIDRMWQSHEVEEKAAEIVKIASQMVDQLRITLERLTTLGNSINKTAENYNQVVTSLANGTSSSMVGKIVQLSAYKRELDKSQPVLSEPVIKRMPEITIVKKDN